MKTFLKEFQAFIARGNVIDLAVGVVIGGAFGVIVSSFVEDILMPFLSLFTGRIDLTQWFIALDGHTYPSLQAAEEAGIPVLKLGKFLNAIVQFILIAFALFMVIRYMIKVRAKAATLAQKTIPLLTVKEKKLEASPQASDRIPAVQDDHDHKMTGAPSTCPYCFEPIHPQATRCPHCTSELSAEHTG